MEKEYKTCRESYRSWIFFIIGLIATAAIRGVTLLDHIDEIYGKLAWYIGVGGFFIFFLYKYNVGQARNKIIESRNLTEKIANKEKLEDADYAAMNAILCSLTSNRERVNYFFIFTLSALAFLLALYLDLFI